MSITQFLIFKMKIIIDVLCIYSSQDMEAT